MADRRLVFIIQRDVINEDIGAGRAVEAAVNRYPSPIDKRAGSFVRQVDALYINDRALFAIWVEGRCTENNGRVVMGPCCAHCHNDITYLVNGKF